MPGEAGARRPDLQVARELEASFRQLLPWLASPQPLWSARLSPQSWSVAEICEHVALANHFLLILVDKLAAKSLRRLNAGTTQAHAAPSLASLDEIAARDFRWTHPEHMTPTGHASREELRARLESQLERCRGHLAALPAPRGSFATIRMSVVDRKLDLYEYLHVLHLHQARHIAQIKRTASS